MTAILTLTCSFLRILIVTSVYNIVVLLTSSEQPRKLRSILSFVILLHHGLSVWCLWFNRVFLDWLLISGELSAWFILEFYTWQMDRWAMSKDTVLLGSLYVQMIALIFLWIIRGIMMIRFPSGLFLPLNLDHPQQNSWKRLQLIFGRSLWSPNFQEGNWKHGIFISVRAILALAIFLGMIIFAIFCLIIWPVSETGMVPVKTMISPGVRWDFQLGSLGPGWNVFVILDRDLNATIVDALPNATSVTALWDSDHGQLEQVELCPHRQDKPECIYRGTEFSDDIDPSLKYNTPANVAVHAFHYFCPNRCTRNLTLTEFLKVPPRDTMPDLLVKINFATLGIPPLSSTVGGSRLMTVGIIVAFTENVDDVLRVSTQTSLLPGMHLLGRVGLEFRSLFARSYLAAFGLASPSDTFIAGTVYDLTQDPAPPPQDSTTTASIRLYVTSDRSDWRFIQEDREKSVLGGFAAIGGLWTSIAGAFSFFFGGSLALLLWGRKPLSIFGVFDRFWKETLNAGIPPVPVNQAGAPNPNNANVNPNVGIPLVPVNQAGAPNPNNANVNPNAGIPLVPVNQAGALNPTTANVNWTLEENDWVMIKLLRKEFVDLGPLERP